MTEKWSSGWNPTLDAWVLSDGSVVTAAELAAGSRPLVSFESFTARVRRRMGRVVAEGGALDGVYPSAVRSGRERLGE